MEKINKDRVVLILRNQEPASDGRHCMKHFLDMDIELRYMKEESDSFADSCPLVRDGDIGETDELELISLANSNTQRYFKPVLYSMAEVAECIVKGGKVRNLLAIPGDSPENMYVLTNDQGHFGAGVIMDENVLERVGEMMNKDFYILPSSIHEVILIPDNGIYDPHELVQTVREVNRTVLSEEDKLSDSVYMFECETKKLRRVA